MFNTVTSPTLPFTLAVGGKQQDVLFFKKTHVISRLCVRASTIMQIDITSVQDLYYTSLLHLSTCHFGVSAMGPGLFMRLQWCCQGGCD